MKCRFLLVLFLLVGITGPAAAGIFGKKPAKPDPKVRVGELVVIVKTDKDESKRAAAAEELREYDPKAYPEILPILIDVLMNDPKPGVRTEAAQSIGKLRPVTPEAGWALEQAAAKDSSMRVRWQAKSSLLQYHWAGYRSPKDGAVIDPKDGPKIDSPEPPLYQDPKGAPPPAPRLAPTPAPVAVPTSNRPQTNVPVKPGAQPSGPQLIPTEPPLLNPPPSSRPSEGPVLDP